MGIGWSLRHRRSTIRCQAESDQRMPAAARPPHRLCDGRLPEDVVDVEHVLPPIALAVLAEPPADIRHSRQGITILTFIRVTPQKDNHGQSHWTICRKLDTASETVDQLLQQVQAERRGLPLTPSHGHAHACTLPILNTDSHPPTHPPTNKTDRQTQRQRGK